MHQTSGAIAGAVLATAMFATPTTLSTTDRATPATVLGEVVATAGLVLLIVGLTRTGRNITVIAAAVGSYIGAAYWFTSSTSFANPAVTGLDPGSWTRCHFGYAASVRVADLAAA